jgi:hypothetical protein
MSDITDIQSAAKKNGWSEVKTRWRPMAILNGGKIVGKRKYSV